MTLRGLFPVLDGLIDEASLAAAERRFIEIYSASVAQARPEMLEKAAIHLMADIMGEIYLRPQAVG